MVGKQKVKGTQSVASLPVGSTELGNLIGNHCFGAPYLVEQPRTEEHLQEVVHDQHLAQLEGFPVFH